MEDFASKERKGIKEKNLYILHLDTPRIIIISSVIICLVIISVLIGMNINKKDKDNESFVRDSALIDNMTAENTEKTGLPETGNAVEPSVNNDSILKYHANENSIITAENALKLKDNTGNSQIVDNTITKEPANKNASDILTNENIETIIPPANSIKKSESKKTAKKSGQKHPEKIKETKKSKGVVEVSSKIKSFRASESNKTYYSIQVAAFDKKSKAQTEIDNLENKKYNAYIDSAKVNGKTFYRVMIGPIYSKKKACSLLDEISADNRYEESYIIKR